MTRDHPKISRRQTKQIQVGSIKVGGGAPITVQSMTTTPTSDIEITQRQIQALRDAGAGMVRLSVNHRDALSGFQALCEQNTGYPLIADIHFDYRLALGVLDTQVACLRINPGNIGAWHRVVQVVEKAKQKCVPIRIGVNAGSLEKEFLPKTGEITAECLVNSALKQAECLLRLNYDQFKISVKASDPWLVIEAYEQLSAQIDQPLHLGVTEAGTLRSGSIKSAFALGYLLSHGIGDTLRISLAADPVEEVKVGYELLRAVGLNHSGINFIACPTCARQTIDVIGLVNRLEKKFEYYRGPRLDVAIMGCAVNGPGECVQSTIGIAGSAEGKGSLYLDGQHTARQIDNLDIEAILSQQILLKIEERTQKSP